MTEIERLEEAAEQAYRLVLACQDAAEDESPSAAKFLRDNPGSIALWHVAVGNLRRAKRASKEEQE